MLRLIRTCGVLLASLVSTESNSSCQAVLEQCEEPAQSTASPISQVESTQSVTAMSLFGRSDSFDAAKPKPHTGVVDHLVQLITSGPRQASVPAPPAHHPLDPLSPDEITTASNVCKRYGSQHKLPSLRFNAITLQVKTYIFILFC